MGVKRFLVGIDSFKHIFTQGYSYKVIKDGIPENSRVVATTFDPMTNSMVMFVEHESFESVEHGTMPPALPAVTIKYDSPDPEDAK